MISSPPLLALLSLLSCDGSGPSPALPPPPPEAVLAEGRSIQLAWQRASLVSISLPASSREGAIPERFPPLGGWQALPSSVPGLRLYRGDNPLQAPISPLPVGFGVVDRAGQPLPRGQGQAGRWMVADKQVLLWLPEDADPTDYALVHPATTAQLAGLNRESQADLSDVDFLLRTERLKQARRHGVYLPAPAAATWRLRVPPDARLFADAAMMLSPWRAEQGSDGATLVVEVLPDDGAAPAQEVARVAVGPGKWEDVAADLSAWAGQAIHLRLRSEAGGTTVGDYLLVGEPLVYTPQPNPRRIVLIFVDTLRADRLGLSGYARSTTPNLDAWGADAAMFTEVRSVAPWTYPSMRAVLSGRMPDRWDAGPVLPERLAEAGWITTAFVNNAYLSSIFGMDRGWSWHFYDPEFSAGHIVGGALNAIQKTPDRDLVLLLQFMDVHLPYTEPEPYRSHWVQGEIPGLSDPILRGQVVDQYNDPASQKAVAQYLSDRYDQSLRHLDKRLVPLLQALDEDDVVIVFGDHGEEFLEHGGLEHGHSLHDELLRVPLLVRAPGVSPGRVTTPASLLDLAPTILDLAGLPADPALPGQSLVAATLDPTRPHGFGYILHGDDAWGVQTADHHKWILSGDTARDYDLVADPGEQQPQVLSLDANTPDVPPFAADLSAALERPVAQTWRVVLPESWSERPRTVRLSAAGGLAATWAGQESPELVPPQFITEDDGSVRVVAGDGPQGFLPRELFAQTRDPSVPVEIQAEGGALSASRVWAPQPVGERLKARDAEVQSQLEALGYLDPAE